MGLQWYPPQIEFEPKLPGQLLQFFWDYEKLLINNLEKIRKVTDNLSSQLYQGVQSSQLIGYTYNLQVKLNMYFCLSLSIKIFICLSVESKKNCWNSENLELTFMQQSKWIFKKENLVATEINFSSKIRTVNTKYMQISRSKVKV